VKDVLQSVGDIMNLKRILRLAVPATVADLAANPSREWLVLFFLALEHLCLF
jgi:hypothetical protein